MAVEKATARGELCFATRHIEKECAQQGNFEPGIQDCMKAMEAAVLALTVKATPGGY